MTSKSPNCARWVVGTSIVKRRFAGMIVSGLFLLSTTSHADPVTAERLLAAADDTANWLTHGRDYREQRHVSLTQINDDNIGELGLAWTVELPTTDGFSATPLVIDGTIYMSTAFANVFAIDARTGEIRWHHNPLVDPSAGFMNSWVSRINRGVAAWKDKIYVGTGDCRLIALNAASGEVAWQVKSCDPAKEQAISGAPRVANGKVFIGNSGADLGARGFVTAYDAETGEQRWRFWTVPGNPADGFENAAMEMAAKTWSGGEWWQFGGGAAWDAIVYDQDFNQVIFGTDAAGNWDHSQRSPGGGDNLFTNSIVAVDADTGTYRWHYQVVPEDSWDFNANMHIILAELEIDGAVRKVMMQAPKNGFFYVIDRADGRLYSAQKFSTVTWAERIDLKTGRPVLIPAARYHDAPDQTATVYPTGIGAHNWHPMSFHPGTGLVYIPAIDLPSTYTAYTGEGGDVGGVAWDIVSVAPRDRARLKGSGFLLAWDPVKQAPRWRAEHALPFNAGVLSTAGNLVFQGDAERRFSAYRADSGERLWSAPTGAPVQAAPVSYTVDGEQFVLLPVGISGFALLAGAAYFTDEGFGTPRLLAFKLGGSATLPPPPRRPRVPPPPARTASAAVVEQGAALYKEHSCMFCHGIDAVAGGGSVKDLRYLSARTHAEWHDVVLGGSRRALGMPSFGEALSVQDSDAIHAYVLDLQHRLYVAEQE